MLISKGLNELFPPPTPLPEGGGNKQKSLSEQHCTRRGHFPST